MVSFVLKLNPNIHSQANSIAKVTNCGYIDFDHWIVPEHINFENWINPEPIDPVPYHVIVCNVRISPGKLAQVRLFIRKWDRYDPFIDMQNFDIVRL